MNLELDDAIELTIAESIAKDKGMPLENYLINALSRQIISDIRSYCDTNQCTNTELLKFIAGLILDAEERIRKEIEKEK